MTVRLFMSRLRCLRLIGLLLLGTCLAACRGLGAYQGTHLDPALEVPPITGLDHEAQPFDSAALRGKVVVVFFGYLFCPDYCPAIMQEIADAYADHLARRQHEIEVLFVTLDPDRDGPAQLALYTAAFHNDFKGIYIADTARLETLKTRYGVFAAVDAPDTEAGSPYLVDHSTRTYVLNREGKLELAYGADLEAQVLARDLRRLLQRSP